MLGSRLGLGLDLQEMQMPLRTKWATWDQGEGSGPSPSQVMWHDLYKGQEVRQGLAGGDCVGVAQGTAS